MVRSEYRLLPAAKYRPFDWYAERISEQQAVLDELDVSPSAMRSWCWCRTYLAGEPIGPKALGELLECARRRDGSHRPGRCRPSWSTAESGSGLGSVYRLRLELPQVDSSALTLGRVDDD